MPSGVELATAWVRLVPSAEGIQGGVTKALAPGEKEAESSGKRAGSKFSTAAKASMAAGALVVAGAFAKVFQTGMEEIKFGEQISAQTDTLIKNTGAAFSTGFIEDYTLALSQVSGVSEEDLQSAGNAVLKFGDVSQSAYEQAVSSINDMAAAGKDVAGVGEALGKALADPAAAAGLLKRAGVILNDEQQATIDKMIEVGDKAGAQQVILDSLEGTYGGMAEAAGATAEGGMNKLSNSFENLAGVAVTALMPTITAIVAGLTEFFNFLQANPALVQAMAVVIGILAVAFVALSIAMWAASLTPIGIIIGLIVLAVALLIAAIIFLVMNWDAVWATVMDIAQAANDWIVAVFEGFMSWWNDLWTAVWEWIVSVWQGIVQGVQNYFNMLMLGLMIIGSNISNWWNGLWQGVVQFFADAWNNIMNVINTIGSVFGRVFGAISGIVQGAFQGVVGVVRGVINSVIRVVNGAINGINAVVGTAGAAFGLSIRVPTIPMLAKGGTITGSGAVIVGENGPEMLRLPAGAQVDPNIDDYTGGGTQVVEAGPRLSRLLAARPDVVVILDDESISDSAKRGNDGSSWRGSDG